MLEEWTDGNVMNFDKNKCKSLHREKKKTTPTCGDGYWLSGEQLCQKSHGGFGRQQGEHEPAVSPGSRASQHHPGVCEQEHSQEIAQGLLLSPYNQYVRDHTLNTCS